MAERRINPETGIVEENVGFIWDNWQPAKNDEGKIERVNPESGVHETDESMFQGTFGYTWEANKNDQGKLERTNPETGVREEDHSFFQGTFGHTWEPLKNEQGQQERINPATGVREEDHSFFQGTFGHSWEPIQNEQGRTERINPRTGVHEEDQSLFHGVFGHTWEPKKADRKGQAIRAFVGSWDADKSKPAQEDTSPENVDAFTGYGGSGQETSFGTLLLVIVGVPALLLAVGAIALVTIVVLSSWGTLEHKTETERSRPVIAANQPESPSSVSNDPIATAPEAPLQSDENSETTFLGHHDSESAPAKSTTLPENPRNERSQLEDPANGAEWSRPTKPLVERMIRAAVAGKKSEVKRYLNENVVDVNAKDEEGYTALIAAAEGGHDALVRLLLENRAEVDAKNDLGETALILASKKGHGDVAKVLLESGANVNERDVLGETPLTKARRFGHKHLIQLLSVNGGIE